MKNKLIGIVCIIALFIPAIVAVILFKPQESDVVQSDSPVVKILITDSLLKKYEVTDSADIDNLKNLIKGTEVSAVPDGVLAFSCFDLTFISENANQTVYRVYMSAQRPDEIYYTVDAVKYFKADSLAGRTFMKQDYAISLYDTTAPVLRVGMSNTVVMPSSMSWNYKDISGEYSPVESVSTSAEILNIDDIERIINYSFSIQPTALTIVICGDVDKSYTAADFPELLTTQTGYQKLKFIARWDTSDSATGYGEAEYELNALVRATAAFLASGGNVSQGGLLELAVKNGVASMLKFTCTPSLGYEPVFYSDGTTARAYLPIAYDAAVGDYTMTLTQEDATSTFTFSVTERDIKEKTFKQSAATVESILSAENKSSLEATITSVVASTSPSSLCVGEKPKYPTKVQDYRTGYGHRFIISATGEEFRHTGIDCAANDGAEIYAVLSGTVAYVGQSDIFGGFVVIDHGMGLKTWYARVSPSVQVGQTVKQDDLIATADNSGFGDDSRVHFAVSSGSVFIDPAILIVKGFADLQFE